MKAVFVDSAYWIAVIKHHDPHRRAALDAAEGLGPARLVTTEEVLVETFSGLGRADSHVRRSAAAFVRRLLDRPDVTVIPQSHESFLSGLDQYEKRLDKGYSLVDCISMRAMQRRRLRTALTPDRHFAQEGFQALMRL